jgi:uncharacterized protein (DUF1810 family)
MADLFNLERFVDAQAPVYQQARRELEAGRKQSHWMWFVFPQIAGLGQSAMSIRFSIASLDEAKAYLAHPVLGPRLRECARLALDVEGKTAREIFRSVDEMKFRSSMTLFARASPEDNVFERCLTKYFGGGEDPATLEGL